MNSRVALYDVGDLVQVIPKDKMEHLPIEEQWVGILPEMLDMGGQEYEVKTVKHQNCTEGIPNGVNSNGTLFSGVYFICWCGGTGRRNGLKIR